MPKGKYKKQREVRKEALEAQSRIQRSLSYFSPDGNYGSAIGYVVMETTHWSEIDWEIIESATEEYRPIVARLITESYEPNANEETLRMMFERYGVDLSIYENKG
jgi:hypothetical protein